MSTLQLEQILRKYIPEENFDISVRALMQDENIWNALDNTDLAVNIDDQWTQADSSLTPARIALFTVDPSIIGSDYPESNLQNEILEEAMLGYETYRSQRIPVKNLKDAGLLAIALYEKFRQAKDWSRIVYEINDVSEAKTGNYLLEYWKTPLVILSGLVDDPRELFQALLQSRDRNGANSVFPHLILSLPKTVDEQVNMVVNALYSLPVESQAAVLRNFYQNGNHELLQKAAKGLFSRHLIHNLENKTVRELWLEPEKYLSEGNSFRELAVVAQYAGEYETAEKLLIVNEQILKTELAGNLIQTAALKADQKQPMTKELENLSSDLLGDPVIAAEVACLGPETVEVEGLNNEAGPYELNEAVKMFRAGNTLLAHETAAKTILEWNEKRAGNSPEAPLRVIHWQPGEMVEKLMEMEMWPEAASMITKLLTQYPVSDVLLKQAVSIAEKQGDKKSQLDYLKKLNLLEPKDEPFRRKLAAAYLDNEDWQSAYNTYQRLLAESGDSEQEDVLGYARAALKCGDFNTAQEFAQKVLNSSPENSQAMAISGYAYHKLGNLDKALALLDRSIEANAEDCEPWLLRADLYAECGETTKSVSTLRSAHNLHPGNTEIKSKLIKSLIENGQAAEALTVIGDGLTTTNKEMALLKLRAMKQLNLPEIVNYTEQLYQVYPNDPEIQKEYASAQLLKGNKGLVRKLLEPVIGKADKELKLAYCDAVLGEDYRNLHSKRYILNGDEALAEKMLQDVLIDDPQNVYARTLLAESLIHQGKTEKAFEFLSNLFGESDVQNSSLFERIQAGFARAASLLEKFDMALGTAQNIVESNPAWAGSGQTLAEIEQNVGEIEEAVDTASDVLEVAPDVVQGVEWFADFMSNLGKEDEAEKVFEKAIKTHKEKNPFRLKLAELKINHQVLYAARELVSDIKTSLPKMKNDGEYLLAARVFNKLGEKDVVEECLSLRSSIENAVAQNALVDLAGFQYTDGRYAKAMESLAEAKIKFGPQRWINLLQADTLHASGNAQGALELLSEMDAANEFLPDTQVLTFIPSEWVSLLKPQASTDALIRCLAFESGNYQEVLENWNPEMEDPGDLSLGIEAGYATGNNSPLQIGLNATPEDERIYESALLAAQVAEILLDAGEFEKAALIIKRALELFPQERILLANASRYSTMIGDLNTAEGLFDQILPQYSMEAGYTNAASVCALRALVKAAIALNRWIEALNWQRVLAQTNDHNLGALQLHLQSLVQALEFSLFTENLGIRQHFDASESSIENIRKELKNTLAGLEPQKNHLFDHWMARAKAVLEPSQANIRALALKTPDADDAAAMMLALQRSGQTNTALQLAGKFEGDPKVMYASAYSLKELEPEKALAVLKNDKKSTSFLPWKSMLAQSLHRKLGENYLAIDDIEEAVQWWPSESEWHVVAADCWKNTGDLQNAIKHLEQAQKLMPEEGRLKYLLGKTYLQAGEIEKSIQVLENASTTAANHNETWETLAEAYYAAGEKEKALTAAEKAGSINGFSLKPMLLSARINLDNGEVRKALEQAQAANRHDENDAESLVILAKSWLANGNKLQALQALEKISHAKDTSVQVLIDQAKLIQQVNGPASAKIMLESLEKKYPENIEVLNMLSDAQLASGDKVAAQGTAQRSLKLQEFQPKVQRFLGKLDLEGGHLDQAVNHFSQAIAQEPQGVDVYLDLSDAYTQQRDFDSALATLDRAIELAPDDIRPLTAQATLLRNGKDYEKAESRLRKAAEIAPNDLNIRRQLGAVIALNLVHSSQEASSNI